MISNLLKKKRLYTVIIFLCIITSYGLHAAEQKQLTFEQVFSRQGESLLRYLPAIRGWAGNTHYYELKPDMLAKVNAANGKIEPVLCDKDTEPLLFKNHLNVYAADDHTPDFRKFLFVNEFDIYYYSFDQKELIQLTHNEEIEENPTFSPDGTQFAYTRKGNLFVYNLKTNQEIQITTDGNEDILNGYASWVYFEEILGRNSQYRAFWWSPDSTKIAFLRFDDTRVPLFYISKERGIYGQLEKQRYPKSGYPNPEVRLGIAQLNQNNNTPITWISLSNIPDSDNITGNPSKDNNLPDDNNDYYLAFPTWNTSDQLYFQWMNRKQNHLRILCYHAISGKLTPCYEEKQPTWIDFLETDDWKILDDGHLIIRSSKDGWYHLYMVTPQGSVRPLTSGNWSVKSIECVNPTTRTVYFMGARETSTEDHYYSVRFDGKGLKRLTEAEGTHTVDVSPDGSYFIDTYSSIHHPQRMEMRNNNGKLLRKLGDRSSPMLETYQLAKQELFRIRTSDGYDLPAKWLLPPGFDVNKKYPVILSIYGGPGNASVANRFINRTFRDHYIAQQGIIVLEVDHRGSGHFGKKGMDLMFKQLGKWEINDYIETVQYLRKLPYIAADRIGITGGSYGGYITALALTQASEYFKCGIADAGVMDWQLYDSVYTERYMDTPVNNPEGYQKAAVFTYISTYKDHTLRLTHGTADDNVHMQNTLQLLDCIQNSGKSTELILYPGERHTFGKKRIIATKEELEFWKQHLLTPDPILPSTQATP